MDAALDYHADSEMSDGWSSRHSAGGVLDDEALAERERQVANDLAAIRAGAPVARPQGKAKARAVGPKAKAQPKASTGASE